MIKRCNKCNHKVDYLQKLTIDYNNTSKEVKLYYCKGCNSIKENWEVLEFHK